MEIVADYSQVETHYDDHSNIEWDEGPTYQLLVCPACRRITCRSYYWHDGYMDPGDVSYETLYPQAKRNPLGLPDNIAKGYEAAEKVSNIDANAYGVLLGRVLELVCEDRNAVGKSLHDRLADLSSKGEIPTKLVDVARGLKDLRNVGAHATLGELTSVDLPILDDLCRAILEYVYSAPHLAQKAQERLDARKNKPA
ncbi:MAG TPA: DUF4145 domain-containing protein [Thermoguttaceae bacterium]|nr:DUF4145 domain-containing protein [Thermoguttaceae bacterium]